jgi:hypothetical protein
MTRSAARLGPALHELVDDLAARRDLPIAEMARRVGQMAEAHGTKRPSYERVRQLVRAARRRMSVAEPSTAEVLWDVALRARPVEAVLDKAAGRPVPRLRP